ncbi:hypothetical protein SAMN05892883_3304 [Jatrophihabitans sp. GAS493]|uniref:hypothetical protein n=1 Tax=Jatrophihabitans sp. GAS493 TaxID=1907575 RepID=UPI000BBF61F3|nr:hypothetical protein [Jatrophihabitans sp. GAS493]SOD74128.1 hypothetical protein SAMN05892883_3304 [Jatrophihabitans sp. GAS493]
MVPKVGGAAAADLADLRTASLDAIHCVLAEGGDQVVLIGAADESQAHSPLSWGSFAGLGVDLQVALGSPGCGGRGELPLSLTVGAWLLGEVAGPRSGAVGFSVAPGFSSSPAALELLRLAESVDLTLLVIGDGSARRATTSPGYLEPRSIDFDRGVETALRDGDGGALAELDEQLGAALLAAGVPAWRAAGGLLEGAEHDARLLYSDDPFGVQYFAAYWTPRGPSA